MNNEIYDDNAIFLSMVEAIEITIKEKKGTGHKKSTSVCSQLFY